MQVLTDRMWPGHRTADQVALTCFVHACCHQQQTHEHHHPQLVTYALASLPCDGFMFLNVPAHMLSLEY